MGRAGSGGGGRSSGGGHSSSRSGGGHRMGSSGGSRAGSGGSRAGSGSSRSRSSGGTRAGGGMPGGGMPMGGPRGGFGGPGMPPPPPGRMPPPPRRRPVYGGGRRGGGCSLSVLVLFLILVFVIIAAQSCTSILSSGIAGTGSQKSTIAREKLDSGNAYINDCIIDELGWFDQVAKTETRLKDFWNKTGVQPYIILRDYDESLTTETQKKQWALDYYDDNFNAENIFLVVYFAEEDTDNDVGYMAYANGYQTSSVMDSEAVEIFWNYLDKYWYTDASTDNVFINAFGDTANTIMHVSTTGKDILRILLIIVAIILIGVIIIKVIKQKNQRARERAEEDQRILNTPIHDMIDHDLEDRYLQ